MQCLDEGAGSEAPPRAVVEEYRPRPLAALIRCDRALHALSLSRHACGDVDHRPDKVIGSPVQTPPIDRVVLEEMESQWPKLPSWAQVRGALPLPWSWPTQAMRFAFGGAAQKFATRSTTTAKTCLLYTSDAADDLTRVDLGGRRI